MPLVEVLLNAAQINRQQDMTRLKFLIITTLSLAFAAQQLPPAASQEDDPERERVAAERFQKLLERAPKRGTAFDRVYGFHVENGSVDEYAQELQQKSATDGNAALILGMVESSRGNDAKAAMAFEAAEKLLAKDPLPSLYLAQSQISVGKPNEAVEAFERALEKSQTPTERLDIYKALGRTHQRSYHQEEALAVWKRMEAELPSNAQVQEEIATALAEDGLNEEALVRYEQLANLSSDNYRKVTYSTRQAELLVRLNRTDEAIAKLEAISETLKPDGWLHRDVRDRIEHVFLRNDNFEGLATYLQEWLTTHPDDIDALARLGQTLASQGRHEDAAETLNKAINAAPTNVKLRELLIQAFVRADNYEKALEQYSELNRIDPGNIDHLIRWGQTVSQNPKLKESERQAAATAVWKKILDKNGDDPVRIVRVAELLRGAEQTDESIALYRKAVELSANPMQYLEYLGEYLHKLDRKDEALSTWQQMAAGKLETPDNLLRLSEVYSQFDLNAEAIATVARAVELEPDRFDLHRAYAQRLMDVEQWNEAIERLDVAAKYAESEEDSDNVFKKRVEALRSGDLLLETTNALEDELNAGTNVTADRWTDLARYAYALSDMKRSVAAVRKAVALDNTSVHVAVTAAEVYESSGQLADAANARNRLAEIDRRFRSVHLMKVAELQLQLGQNDDAYAAGKKVLEAAGSGPEQARFFADLCFRLNREAEAIETLRRNVRLNPNDVAVQWTLAEALATRFKTAEAIEVYWKSFEKCDDLDDKLQVIRQLSDLYLRTNQFERLLSRLERQNSEAEDRRVTTMCLSQAYREIQDYASARVELEKLLAEESKDTQLLSELSKLAEAERDYATAIKYQRRLVEVAAAPNEESRLAELHTRDGDIKAAEQIWAKLAVSSAELHTSLKSVDELMSKERWDAASAIVEQLENNNPGNWELLYRRAIIASWKKDDETARQHFDALIKLPVPRNTKASQALALEKQGSRRNSQPMYEAVPIQTRMSQISRMRYVTGHSEITQDYYKRYALEWRPTDFGQARLAATGWLYNKDGREWSTNAILTALREAGEKDDGDLEDIWNLYEFQRLQYSGDQSYYVAERLSKRGDLEGHYALLSSISARRNHKEEKHKKATSERNQQQLTAFWTLRRERPEWNVMSFTTTLMQELNDVGGKEAKLEFRAELEKNLRTPADKIEFISATRQTWNPRLILTTTAEAGKAFENLRENIDGHRSLLQGKLPELYKSGNSQAKQKKYPLSLQFFDSAMDLLDLLEKGQRRSSSYGSALTTSRNEYNVYTYENDRQEYVRLSYPQPGKHVTEKRVELFRNWYTFFKRDDQLNLLITHLKQRATPVDDSPAAVQKSLIARLGLSYIYGWQAEAGRSMAELTLAQKLVPDDISLLIELCMLQSEAGQFAVALQNIDAFEPLNSSEMQDRELIALNLAVQTGQLERARTAAERLFGLRLSNDIELLLAQQMNQLGMFELSQTVMDRARQKVSRNAGSMVKLMQQYNAQGKGDVAQEVALQLLQGTRRQSVQPGYYNETNSAREQALRLLTGSGKLKELTASVEKQLEKSPNSDALMRTLLEYYQGSGEKEKAATLSARLLETRDDDPQLRFEIADQQSRQGDHQQAMDNFLLAIKQKPELLRNGYHRMQNSLRNTRRGTDLANVLMEMDLNKIGQTWSIGNMVQTLFDDPSTNEAGYKLFDKAWESVKDKHELMRSVSFRDEFWKSDDVWKYVEAFLLDETRKEQFYFFGSYAGTSNGKLIGPFTKCLEVAKRMNKLPEIEAAVAEKLGEEKTRLVNTALLAILDAHQQRPQQAIEKLQGILSDEKAQVDSNSARVIGQSLESVEGVELLVIQLYERTLDEVLNDQDEVYDQSIGKALYTSYKKLDQKEKAHALLKKFASRKSNVPSYNLEYEAERTLTEQQSLGKDFLELGYPIDAIQILNKAASNQKAQDLASRWGRNRFDFTTTIAAAITALKDVPAGELLDGFLPDPSTFQPRDGVSAIELGLVVQPETLDAATVNCPITQVLTESKSDVPEEALAKLEALSKAAPDDISVAIVKASLSLKSDKAADAMASLARLVSIPVSAETPPAQLESRIAVWPLAQLASSREDLQPFGVQLADAAVAAANVHPERKWQLAIAREQAEQAAKSGDLKAAETAYARLIAGITAAGSPSEAAETPAANTDANTGAAGRVLNSDQFDNVVQVAESAAVLGLTDFAVNAIFDALKNGPPLDPISLDQLRNRSSISSSVNMTGTGHDERFAKVATRLVALSKKWKTQEVAPEPVFNMLSALVLPKDKSTIHPFWSSAGAISEPTGLMHEAIGWAKKAEKTNQFLDSLQIRSADPASSATAKVGTLLIHHLNDDLEKTREVLIEMKIVLDHSEEADAAAAAILFSRGASAVSTKEELAAENLDLLMKCLQRLPDGYASQLNDGLQASVAHVAKSMDAAAATELVNRYLTLVDPRKNSNQYAEYSGYLRRQQLTTVIAILLEKDQLQPALKFLAEGLSVNAERYGEFYVPGAVNNVQRLAAAMSATDRYELLSKWVFPENDATVLADLPGVAGSAVPERFLKLAGKPVVEQSLVPVSMFGLVLDTAEAAGRLDDLKKLVATRKHERQMKQRNARLIRC